MVTYKKETIISKKRTGGTGFQPVQNFHCTKRNLPHWQLPGSVYFITWRCLTGITLSSPERHITLDAIRLTGMA